MQLSLIYRRLDRQAQKAALRAETLGLGDEEGILQSDMIGN